MSQKESPISGGVTPTPVTAPRGRVADKHSSSWFSGDLGNRGKVPQVLGTSREWSRSRLSFHNSEIGAEVREGDKNLD
jgi:hypothetical protein